MRRYLLALIFIPTLTHCGPSLPTPSAPRPCDQVTPASSHQTTFDVLPSPKLYSFEVANPDDVSITQGHLALRIRGGILTNGGNRAELSMRDSDPLCQESWTQWRFQIPRDFVDASTQALRWQTIAQWHDQPDTAQGQDWENYPANSPMISINYALYDERYAAPLKEAGIDHTFEQDQPLVILSYGWGDLIRAVGALPVEKGKWLTLTAHTRMSLDEDGFAAIWVDGQPLANAREARNEYIHGRNMYNAAPAYLKLGIYRNPEIRDINTVLIDDIIRSPVKIDAQ